MCSRTGSSLSICRSPGSYAIYRMASDCADAMAELICFGRTYPKLHFHTLRLIYVINHLILNVRKCTFCHVCPNENSNQSAHPHSLIRVFVARGKEHCIRGYLKCAQWRFWIFARRTCPKGRFLAWGFSFRIPSQNVLIRVKVLIKIQNVLLSLVVILFGQ